LGVAKLPSRAMGVAGNPTHWQKLGWPATPISESLNFEFFFDF
jgi:hypothetical protein